MKKKAKRLIKDVILNFIIALFWTISLLILFVFAMKNTEYATNDNIEIWLLMFLSVNFMLILLYKLYVENSKVLLTMNLTKSFNMINGIGMDIPKPFNVTRQKSTTSIGGR